MGKTSEAAVYRKFINSMKKKTKKMNEEKENGRCKAGEYYCYTDKVCKPIPKGFMVDPEGMLRKENGSTIDEEGLRDWFGKSNQKVANQVGCKLYPVNPVLVNQVRSQHQSAFLLPKERV